MTPTIEMLATIKHLKSENSKLTTDLGTKDATIAELRGALEKGITNNTIALTIAVDIPNKEEYYSLMEELDAWDNDVRQLLASTASKPCGTCENGIVYEWDTPDKDTVNLNKPIPCPDCKGGIEDYKHQVPLIHDPGKTGIKMGSRDCRTCDGSEVPL